MELVTLVVMLGLIQYIWFGIQVGQARGKYGIKAPAITGHPVFERHVRVHANTLEQLVAFIPVSYAFAWHADSFGWYGSEIAAFLGVIFLIGRQIYARAYVNDPASRSIGFLLTFAPCAIMIVGALIAVLVSVVS
jgi:glutathione S-transferase